MESLSRNYGNRIDQIVEQAPIREVWRELGGGDLRGNRGRAFWRDGDGYNVSLNDSKGAWYDHARSEGGGVLVLVELVLQCDRKEAVRWLAEFAGVPLDDMSPEQRREYARRREQARIEADALVFWKKDTLALLRDYRDQLQGTVLSAQRFALAHIHEEHNADDPRWDACWWASTVLAERVEELNAQIDRLQTASYAELLPLFRARYRGQAA